jgi:hypothetical protein
MPIFKGRASKARPQKGLSYITDPKKAVIVSSHGLNDSKSYAEQFEKTAQLFGKAQNKNSRKYYHFKLAFSPNDGVTAEQAYKIASVHTQTYFKNNEYVIAVHTDKAHMHAHIIVNSLAFTDGKMLQISPQMYGRMKDLANELSVKYGFSAVDFRKPSQVRDNQAEHHILLKGGISWKDELREVIDL